MSTDQKDGTVPMHDNWDIDLGAETDTEELERAVRRQLSQRAGSGVREQMDYLAACYARAEAHTGDAEESNEEGTQSDNSAPLSPATRQPARSTDVRPASRLLA